MRFINTETLRFEIGAEEDKYAVLSHRWSTASEDEISYADIAESRDISHKAGFAKFQGFCNLAAELGCRYAWDDTCCINKGDLSEMSEAINSMYRWYQISHICIVYLEDVVEKNKMMDSLWFNRGWTLQELIGPRAANFYDRDWNIIGTKAELLSSLSSKTGIPESVLSHKTELSKCSVAQRMSWAAARETTRIEDRAYSLLGIFGVSMLQNYGEREKAFLRLQRAIMLESKDESIFAWEMNTGSEDHESKEYTGLLAPSPSNFLNCRDVNKIPGSGGFSEKNGELVITLRTLPYSMETYSALLHCSRIDVPEDRITILVSRLVTENEYVRVAKSIPGGLGLISPSKTVSLKDRIIRVSIEPFEAPLNRVYGFWLRTFEPPGHQDCQRRILSRSQSSSKQDIVYLAEGHQGTAGIIHMKSSSLRSDYKNSGWSLLCWLRVGFDADFNPMLFLANDRRAIYMWQRKNYIGRPEEISEEAFDTVLASDEAKESASSTTIPHSGTLFDNRWLNSSGGVPSRSYGWPDGFSILRVDRQHGISGSLQSLNLHISVSLVPDPTSPSCDDQRTASDGPHIWTIDITDTGGSDPEKELRQLENDASRQASMVGFFMACCCIYDPDAIDARASQRDAAANVRKVLGDEDLI